MHDKVVLYARVSSKEQEQEGFSIPAQLKILKEYAEKQRFKILKEFIDVETAKQSGRTSFGNMVSFLKENPDSRIILCEKTDRLYRNFRDYVTIDDLDLEIHLVKEGEILSKESKSHQKFIHGIKVLLAKNYIDNLSEEVKKGMREKAEQGIYPSIAPLGYRNVEVNGKKCIAIDPEVAPLIGKLFEWYSTGKYSLLEITRKAQEEGLTYRKSKTKVHKSIVHKILSNPIYYGDFEWNGRLYKGVHEPIISKELFEAVQRLLDYRGQHLTRMEKHRWAFQGLVHCGHCGSAMTAEIKKKRYVYYHCTGHKGKCPEKYVREEELAKQFGEALAGLWIDDEALGWITTALKTSHQDEKAYHAEIIQKLQREHDRLQSRLDQMYVDKLDGKITSDFFDKKSGEWRQQQSDILAKISIHQNANRSYMDVTSRVTGPSAIPPIGTHPDRSDFLV